MIDVEKIASELKGLGRIEQMKHLERFYPSLALYIFRRFKLTAQLDQYRKECISYKDDYRNY